MEHWLYQNKEFSEISKGNYGFVYKITNLLDGRMYIGRKYFWSIRKQKSKKNRKRFESDWKIYYGSCPELTDDVLFFGKEYFKREILTIHKTKGQVNFAETKLQFHYDVINACDIHGYKIYYNRNILGRYYTPKHLQYSPRIQEIRENWNNFSKNEKQSLVKKCPKNLVEFWDSLTYNEKEEKIEQLKENYDERKN